MRVNRKKSSARRAPPKDAVVRPSKFIQIAIASWATAAETLYALDDEGRIWVLHDPRHAVRLAAGEVHGWRLVESSIESDVLKAAAPAASPRREQPPAPPFQEPLLPPGATYPTSAPTVGQG